MGTTYEKYPKPAPDKNAGRSATQVSDRHTGGGLMGAAGAMGKYTDTGDGMENESGISGGKKKKGNPGHKMSY
jgi:hypothetical protein